VTTAVIIDDLNPGGFSPSGNTIVEKTVVLRKFEKAPVVIYQKLGQFVEMDTDAASPNFLTTPTSGDNKVFSHNSGPGDIEQSGQAVCMSSGAFLDQTSRPKRVMTPTPGSCAVTSVEVVRMPTWTALTQMMAGLTPRVDTCGPLWILQA
jgi:hypothetical protein